MTMEKVIATGSMDWAWREIARMEARERVEHPHRAQTNRRAKRNPLYVPRHAQ